MVKYVLKAGKETSEVEHTAEESFEDFQIKVFTITDIPPKNLKVLFKSKMVKDNATLLAFPEGSALIVMGTKSGKELKLSADVKIESKMEVEDDDQVPQRYGLVNCGNTCYMNSAIQLLRSIPELNQALKKFSIGGMMEQQPEQLLTKSLGAVFHALEKKDLTPEMFVGLFLQTHETYLPLGTQHDSDEFMQELFAIFARTSPELAKSIKSLFQIEFVDVTKNLEIEEEPKYEISNSTKVCCNVGDVDVKIGTFNEGIKLSLETKLQKMSQIDNTNHIYEKTTRFNSIPPYLLIQMVRFFWKKAEDMPHAKPNAAKICKSITFSLQLDIFDYCTEELKETLKKGREVFEEQKKNEEVEYKVQYEAFKESIGTTSRPEKRLIEQFSEKWKREKKEVRQGLDTGFYEMIGTVTHLGNSVESGHYMAWVKQNEQEWTKYDDNTVYQQSSEKVLQLRGGQPNLEIAYVLLFRKVYAKPL